MARQYATKEGGLSLSLLPATAQVMRTTGGKVKSSTRGRLVQNLHGIGEASTQAAGSYKRNTETCVIHDAHNLLLGVLRQLSCVNDA